MRKKRIMLVGPCKSGKTTLAEYLEGNPLRPVQNIAYRTCTIDTPGAYLESPWMRSHLIAAAQDASCLVMVADATAKRDVYPPGFAHSFRVPIIGVVMKSDLPNADCQHAAVQLVRAGVPEPIHIANKYDADALACLKKWLEQWQMKEYHKKGG